MLIGLTGRGAGRAFAADYLARTHAFVAAPSVTDALVDELSAHHVLVLDLAGPEDAQELRVRGGIVVHLVDPALPNFGPDNGIELRPIDREINAALDICRACDALDALVGDAEFMEG
ncbi:hypothetical protein AB4Z48_17795 [Cupriavidus sp. 2TAF22]|uniref:hypothetical protein n=1 Tax=unclassified Cupriavidus TaxID=2640874 RepID=UPI003F90A83B